MDRLVLWRESWIGASIVLGGRGLELRVSDSICILVFNWFFGFLCLAHQRAARYY